MSADKSSKGAVATGVFAAIAASSCCIPPVIAAIAGIGGASASLSWMEPLRPYLIGLAVIAIGYAWYNHLKPKKDDDCGCEIEKPKFYQTKGFLIGITVFAAVSISFPYYSYIFFPKTESKVVIVDSKNIALANFEIEGMTCQGCEEEVKHEVSQLPGFIEATVNHETGNATVKFDKSKTSLEQVVSAINKTGYKVTKQDEVKKQNQ
ncbi:MAG: mercuric transport protein MerTP [Bacteroidetes bacterium]|nr:mercuric transport protein MerTP [Bacteroidota bacterium]